MHAIRQAIPERRSRSGRYTVHGLPAATDNVVWVLEDHAEGRAAIVDGPDAAAALALIEQRGLFLSTVLLTHGHGDHVGVVHDLGRRDLLGGVSVVGGAHSRLPLPSLTYRVEDGDHAPFADALVLRTDGHVTGHVSYVIEDLVFVGDTMFAGGCGYLFDGPAAAMWASLERLAALPPETHVFCAHEYTEDNLRFALSVAPEADDPVWNRYEQVVQRRAQGHAALLTTIGEERATNVFVRAGSAERFAALRQAKDSRAYRAAPPPTRPIAGLGAAGAPMHLQQLGERIP